MAHHKRGRAVCENTTVVRMDSVDREVLSKIGGEVLRPDVVEAVLSSVFDALADDGPAKDAARLREELATTNREADRLTEAIAAGGRMDALLTALRERQGRRDELERLLAASADRPTSRLGRAAIERRVRRQLEEWRSLLTRQVQDGRQLFREVLEGPIRFWPIEGQRAFRFEGKADLSEMFAGVAGVATFVASPAGFEPAFWP
jgi:hypothetical protein